MLKLLLILGVLLFLGARVLPKIGSWLGVRARKPVRMARMGAAWATGTEEEEIAAEREYGRECARELVEQFERTGAQQSPPIRSSQQLLDRLGAKLTKAVRKKKPGYEFRFHAMHDSSANAFALPGGFIFVSDPLIRLCGGDEDEIAFVLGHEMAHVTGGHVRDRMIADGFVDLATRRLAGSGRLLRELIGKGYSREQELEADREGAALAAAAGFDRDAAVRVLRRLGQELGDGDGIGVYFSSHPAFSERVRELGGRA